MGSCACRSTAGARSWARSRSAGRPSIPSTSPSWPSSKPPEAAADQIGLALDNARLYSESLRQLDELKRAHAQLIHAEKMKAVGELASGVAHEINNPLTTILGQTHLLLTHPETTSHVRDRLGIVAEEAGRAARIVQNLLLFARHYTPERRPCSVADQARRVLELKGYQLQQDNVRVVTDFASCPFVWADENQLQVVLLNLVQNAHQAMAKHPAHRVLTVRVWPSEGHACVEVRDTGPGIPADALSRIFDPFFTTKPPPTRSAWRSTMRDSTPSRSASSTSSSVPTRS